MMRKMICLCLMLSCILAGWAAGWVLAAEPRVDLPLKISARSGEDALREAEQWIRLEEKEHWSRYVAVDGDLEAVDMEECTLLHQATALGCPALCELLISSGADVNAQNNRKKTPLMTAARQPEMAGVVVLLLQAGADVKSVTVWEDTPLHYAVCSCNPAIVEMLLTAGAPVNVRMENGATPLMNAVRYENNVAIVDMLLKAGADIKIPEVDGNSPLHIACRSGDLPMVESLLAAGGDVRDTNKFGDTALHYAAFSGNPAVVAKVLSLGGDVNARLENGETPLMIATQNRSRLAVIDPLIAAGADVSFKNHSNWTALHFAAQSGSPEMVAKLISAGANVRSRNNVGYTPLHLAANCGEPLVIELLLAAGADIESRDEYEENTALLMAAGGGALPVLEKLLAAGADLKCTNRRGETPLHRAARYRGAPVIERLVQAGGDVDARMEGGETPLMLAAQNANGAEAFAQLLKAGADVQCVNASNNSILHYAVQGGNVSMVEKILAAGVDVNAKNGQGETPLFQAVGRLPEIARMLLENGANPNARSNRNATPLHRAVCFDKTDVTQLLLAAGADINACDDEGRTPLVCCFGSENPNFDLLLEAGADVNFGKEGKNSGRPIEAALQTGHIELVIKLLDAGAKLAKRTPNDPIPLFLAARLGDRRLMERLVEMGEDIHERDSNRCSLLTTAAEAGDLETMKWLIGKGLNVNQGTPWGRNALGRAVERQDIEMVRFLLELGADPAGEDVDRANGGDYNEPTRLWQVIERGDLEMLRLLVKHGAPILDDPKSQGKKYLHCAVDSESVEMCEYILRFNPNVDTRTEDCPTPLCYAVGKANFDVCVLLLSHGADPNGKSDSGGTPMGWITNSGGYISPMMEIQYVRVWRLLLDAGAKSDVQNRQGKTVVDSILERYSVAPGADPVDGGYGYEDDDMPRAENAKKRAKQEYKPNFLVKYIETSTGQWRNAETPDSLFMAAHEGDKERVKRLLKSGQSVNRKDRDDETPLHFAVRAGNTDMVKFLLDEGADVHAKGIHKGTPFHYAAALGQAEILELLLEQDANEDEKSNALCWAVAGSNGPCVVVLVKKGADSTAAFSQAMYMKKELYCKYFCQNGLDLNAYAHTLDIHGMYNTLWQNTARARVTLACGGDVNMRCKEETTPLYYAVTRGEVPMAAFLMQHGADPTAKPPCPPYIGCQSVLEYVQNPNNRNSTAKQIFGIILREMAKRNEK